MSDICQFIIDSVFSVTEPVDIFNTVSIHNIDSQNIVKSEKISLFVIGIWNNI